MRNLLSLNDLTAEEFRQIIDSAIWTKKNPYHWSETLIGKQIGLFFEKPSTRTRISFEAAVNKLGGRAIVLKKDEIQISRGEPLKDTAIVLGRYLDGLVARTNSHSTLEVFAEYSNIPIINALSDKFHPCQAIADFMTIKENNKDYETIKICYLGDGNNNVCHSLLNACSMTKTNIFVCSPEKYGPDKTIVENARSKGANIKITTDPEEAADKADVFYTDVWVSMGQENEREQRLTDLKNYQLNDNLLKRGNNDCIVLHCLPAKKGEEITENVMYSKNSKIFDQAENRLHTQKSLLHFFYYQT
ncbi:MAG: ornithine carbamoyltransferase [Spirochaetia bacterium]|nr:ornithine carbamoyltransferase [Spirochaetia bacterium]